jgi:CheY-like chemotaxis protein
MVYLVDDDLEDLEILQEALHTHSYKGPVLTMENGHKLLAQLGSNGHTPAPQVIVLDLNMPLLDGFQTLARIREHPTFGSIPVIVLTASSKTEDEKRSYELGCNFFLTKPSRIRDYDQLTTLVKKFIVPHQTDAS